MFDWNRSLPRQPLFGLPQRRMPLLDAFALDLQPLGAVIMPQGDRFGAGLWRAFGQFDVFRHVPEYFRGCSIKFGVDQQR